MVHEQLRPIREIERNELLSLLAVPSVVRELRTGKWLMIWFGFMAMIVAATVCLILSSPHPVVGGLIGGVLATAALICLYAIIMVIQSHFNWRNAHRRFVASTRPLVESTLNSGMVFSKRIVATSVVELCEFEDEGSGYLFDVGDNRSFFLKGQWTDPVDENMPWPCSDFEIVRSSDKKLRIGIFSAGSKLTPIRTIDLAECRKEIVWAEVEEVLPKPLERALDDLLKQK
jgi:hypothetical protein